MIDQGEPAVHVGMEQLGGVRRLTLNAKQDVESSRASRGNRGSRILGFFFHCGQYDGSGRCKEEIRTALGAELFAGQRTIAANEVRGRGAPLAFQL